MADPAYPDVTADFDGWTLAEETVETLFRLPAARVRGATRRYVDERTRTAVCEATGGDIDHQWRFVATTRLAFVPPLPPGTPASILLPMIRREAREAFAQQLSERGLSDVERHTEERLRVRTGRRARVTRFRARDAVGGVDIPVTGWIGVWHDSSDFLLVTGGYPEGRLADLLDLDGASGPLGKSAAEYREEFVDVLRSVR